MSKLVEKMAKRHYERAFEGVVGCCEEPWDQLPPDYRDRICDAMRAALAVCLEEMREPSEGVIDAGHEDQCHLWREEVSQVWRAMLEQFEKENQ